MLAVDCQGQSTSASGWEQPFTDLALMVTRGYGPKLDQQATKPMGPFYRCADISRMRMFYPPKISLEEGVRRAMEA